MKVAFFLSHWFEYTSGLQELPRKYSQSASCDQSTAGPEPLEEKPKLKIIKVEGKPDLISSPREENLEHPFAIEDTLAY